MQVCKQFIVINYSVRYLMVSLDLWVRSLCLQGDKLLVGTHFCEIFEISLRDRDNPKCLLNGHSEGELWALATHPKKPLFATGGDDQTLRSDKQNFQ